MAPGALASTQCQPDQPEHKEENSDNPQKVDGESQPSQEQHEKKRQQDDHEKALP